jgi:acyl-[acyl-carrier-protein]-phospholipid O-acyltransferase/long-chain-fatty-acid--[acyl-carrier-protein] ligase
MADSERLPSGFQWLNVTQFLGALNDNVFKLLVVFLLLGTLGSEHRERVLAVGSAVFVVPFILFANVAGVLADRFSKQRILVVMKVVEIAVMAAGLAAVQMGNEWFAYAILFLMGLQSTLFGPSKYGIVPELVGTANLSWANSLLTMATYLAIIIGTFLPSFLLDKVFGGRFVWLSLFCIGVAVAGTLTSLGISRTPAGGAKGRPSLVFFVDMFRTFRGIVADRYLTSAVLGSAYFVFIGAFIQQTMLLYGQDALGLSWIQSGYLFSVAAVGIGVGAVAAGRVSGRNVEFGVVPVGATGLCACTIALGLIPPTYTAVLTVLFLLGASCGLFIVPLTAFIQQRAPPERRGRVIALESFLGFVGAGLSAGVFYAMTAVMGLSPRESFVVIGALTGLLAAVTFVMLPDFLVRFAVVTVTRCVYRMRVDGVDRVPPDGPVVLLPNHVTWVDALLISATLQRRVRFLLGRQIYAIRWLRPLFRLMGAIPISPDDAPHQIHNALDAARQALLDGYVVCVFPEGGITRNGNLRAFRPGWERIVKGIECPVLPVYIGGGWGSIFSYYHGRLVSSMPRRIPYPVSVVFGEPLPAGADTAAARLAVQELSGRHFDLMKDRSRVLGVAAVRAARRRWFGEAVGDSTGVRLSRGRALVAATALGGAIAERVRMDRYVGILLPASVGGLLANLAVTLVGRVPVNLNFTASSDAMQSALAQADIRTILTSRAFVEKAKVGTLPEGTVVYLEDIRSAIGPGARLRALLKALLVPARWYTGRKPVEPDDVATVIFSSGSTGTPKGVMLSHHNVLSNIESFLMVCRFTPEDRMCAVLPFFHSFGFTCTLWTPFLSGFVAFYHPNPLDSAAIAEQIRERRLTALLTTPTFLLSYYRRAKREDLATLRILIAGAERLKSEVADAFEERFGIRPLEGYGATELSPVVSVCLRDATVDRVTQVGHKAGSVGHPLPGVTARVTDMDTHAVLAPDRQGMLEIKGPNVMLGYLANPKATIEAVREGWYTTGDLAKIDEDGFIFLQGRVSRFSKIGGEMVPHGAVEERLLKAMGSGQPTIFISSAADARKGEQLVVLCAPEAGGVEKVRAAIRDADLPNLWKPRPENCFESGPFPVLGSGKLDLRALKALADRLVAEREGAVEGGVEV